MGTDIHTFVEKRGQHNLWEYVPSIDFGRGRDRWLWGLLAGVGTEFDGEPYRSPRDLPANVSDFVMKAYMDMSYVWHSATWLTLTEILDAVSSQPAVEWESREEWAIFVIRLLALCRGQDHDSVRAIFWFDS